jgi:putative SOS response-associated peptidase YedK
MCGRYDLSRNAQDVFRFFGVQPVDWGARYNIAPTQTVLGIRADEAGQPVARLARWGFKPAHATTNADAPEPINARAEKVAGSPYFRDAFAYHRVIVPADGWYEWREEAGQKQPYRFARADGGLLLFAGIGAHADEAPGERLAIVTEPARGLASEVHSRMPVVLNADCWRAWIDPGLTQRDAIRATMERLPTDALTAYPVSRRVGNPAQDDAALLEATGEPLATDA